MANSKAQKPAKSTAPKKLNKVLVQVRIPGNEHELLAELCGRQGHTIAHRLHMIIQEELDNCYPLAIVSFNGKSLPTRIIVEKHSIPDKDYLSVIVTPENADGILPEALLHSASFVFPHRAAKIFGVASSYQDTSDVWHLQLLKLGTES